MNARSRPTSAVRPAVFLDRDGVLNAALVRDGRPFPPQRLEDWQILPGVPDACKQLRSAGLLLIAVTNQPDIARGLLTERDISVLHRVLLTRIPLDEILVCPHDDSDACDCRKPAPGLLLEAADRWGVELARSVIVGDRWRDIEAGKRAGCWTVFVDAGYAEQAPKGQDLTVSSLAEAVPWILARCVPDQGAK